ncbi:MAG TPA: class I SAM-dependent methyltransferase [Pyrinomonadaceae bacterium]|nr:class I SAM-dependent methyltransferase [Pyrinomonadaceae bacterium]
MNSSIKNALSPETRRNLRNLRLRLLSLKESALWGGTRRESALVKLLNRYYFSLYRRQWELNSEEPHFFSQRIGFFKFAFGDNGYGPYSFYRGFFGSEVVQPNDQLLDIGCGDGFFTKRFLSTRCAKVDAVDIEPSAIESAQLYNNAPNITYYLLDAVNEPFPSKRYDVIVWDGALGHFAKETTDLVLAKIQSALKSNGVFVGSESLGFEGSDHLQFFHSLDDLHELFKPFFKFIELRSIDYRTGHGKSSFVRQEAFWRCANEEKRLRECSWKSFSQPISNQDFKSISA